MADTVTGVPTRPTPSQAKARTTLANEDTRVVIETSQLEARWLARRALQLILAGRPREFGLVAGYLAALATTASAIYYVPNYAWSESATAYHSALVSRFFGIPAAVKVTSDAFLLNDFVVYMPCTGIQVVATFAGILLPLPRVTWLKKAIGLVLVAVGVYLANIVRIVVQLWVYYAGLYDWTLVHGPGGVALGIISVMLLVLLLDRFVPEFGDFTFSIIRRRPV